MCSPSPPPAPDYAAAARETAAGDLENARYQTLANRPNVYTPTGNQTWSRDPDNPDQWTQTQTLNPTAQATFEENQNLQLGLGQLGNEALGSVGDLFSTSYQTPGETSAYSGPEGELSPYGEHRQGVMDAMMSRVNTDIGRDRESKSADLIARGIPQGSEPYNREMEQLDRKQTDARQQAEISATQQATQERASDIAGRQQMGQEGLADFNTGLDLQRQQIQNALMERQTPLNEINAFRTGSQVQQPQFQPYGQQTFTGGPDLLGAAQLQGNYDIASNNAAQAGSNALMGGLFSLGSAYLGAG